MASPINAPTWLPRSRLWAFELCNLIDFLAPAVTERTWCEWRACTIPVCLPFVSRVPVQSPTTANQRRTPGSILSPRQTWRIPTEACTYFRWAKSREWLHSWFFSRDRNLNPESLGWQTSLLTVAPPSLSPSVSISIIQSNLLAV